MKESCRFIKEDGARCQITGNIGKTGFCLWHDENRRAEAAEARSRGAQTANKARARPKHEPRTALPQDAPAAPRTLDDCVEWLSWLAVAVTTGQLDVRVTREAVMAVRELRASVQTRDLEKELEQALRELAQLRRLKAV